MWQDTCKLVLIFLWKTSKCNQEEISSVALLSPACYKCFSHKSSLAFYKIVAIFSLCVQKASLESHGSHEMFSVGTLEWMSSKYFILMKMQIFWSVCIFFLVYPQKFTWDMITLFHTVWIFVVSGLIFSFIFKNPCLLCNTECNIS